MVNFCAECGKPLQPEWNACPHCGATIKTDLIKTQLINIKESIETKKTWLSKYNYLFALLGGIIALIALLTPNAWFNQSYMGMSIERFTEWMFGYSTYYWWETGYEVAWVGPITLFISLTSTIIVIIASIVAIVSANNDRKRGYYPKSTLIIVGCSLVIIIIFYIIMIEILTLNFSFWAILNPGFGIIGVFIGAGLIIATHFIRKKYR